MNNILKIGKIVNGKVNGIESYGIFMEFENGYSGLIHISEISNEYIKDIKEYVQIGEIIPCKILEINYKEKKLKLSIKSLQRKKEHHFENLKKMLPDWIEEKINELKDEN